MSTDATGKSAATGKSTDGQTPPVSGTAVKPPSRVRTFPMAHVDEFGHRASECTGKTSLSGHLTEVNAPSYTVGLLQIPLGLRYEGISQYLVAALILNASDGDDSIEKERSQTSGQSLEQIVLRI
ncbi:hypothetical protein Vadar_008977 [Vaccinium darrowii]|uniref:Uncharacterized protein n=1 Tax=Vaccinium darrowii TaxID=229202 RepID=A0ACB7YCH3_9ERIC|nr:hypothetical protein Vadar_008977 [Vaccinium darrowii]